MTQIIDLNIPPYFDDFSEDKRFHQVLFRPQTAVQARELTQLQTIIQNQIKRYGDYIFQSGDIVKGCTTRDLPSIPFVRLSDFQSNTASYDALKFVNCFAVSATSNLTAKVLVSNNGFSVNYPDTNILYLSYLNSGTSGEKTFSNTDQIIIYTSPRTGNNTADTLAVINAYSNATTNTFTTGAAHLLGVGEGIVYLNGYFVKVPDASYAIVNAYGTFAGNSSVGFIIDEEIITENQDTSLNDNALGYPNENAPGAHRLKINPNLVALSPDELASNTTFSPIVTYNNGNIITKSSAQSNLYSTISETIALRLYEESGNYVVNPFNVDIVSANVVAESNLKPNPNTAIARIYPGVGYVGGQRVELLNTAYSTIRRGVDTKTALNQQITFNYGNYFLLKEVAGSFDFSHGQQVYFFSNTQSAVTSKQFSSISANTSQAIGIGLIRAFNYQSGTPGTNTALYTLHVFNVKMNSGYSSDQISSVFYNGSSANAVGDVAGTGLLGSASKSMLFNFGVSGLKNLRDSSNNNVTEYVYTKKDTVTVSSAGAASITITSSPTGGIDILPYGAGVLPDTDASSISIIFTATAQSNNLAGTVNVFNTQTNVIGTSTSFTTNYNVGDQIKVGSTVRTVTAIANSIHLNVDAFFTANLTGQTYVNYIPAGKIIPLTFYNNRSSYITVTNSTSFAINTGYSLSGASTVDVVYNILRTNVVPASKQINRRRFVKIDTRANPNGPWCLGYPDIFRINTVWGSGDGSYNTVNPDITSYFNFDTGQKDTHYDLGYLYLNPGFNTSTYQYLLVSLDYFSANTSAGSGLYTVESYPTLPGYFNVDNLINPEEIPLYVSENGTYYNLRDCIDFRPTVALTANDTSNAFSSNIASVNTAISYATVNPSNTVTITYTGTGLNVPKYGMNLQANYTLYLPRKDIMYITPTNQIRVKEGLSSPSPQTPIYPDNGMVISTISIPPFPSLTSDQLVSLNNDNKMSHSVIRDVRSSFLTNPITIKRYTMKDIGTLDQRITNLEYYQSLSILEKQASDLTVTDANGLDRFKNGIFVDPFSDFSLSDVSNPEYSSAIDGSKGVARPRISREVITLQFNSLASTNVQTTGRVLTLPYTETPYLSQPYATGYRSAARFAYQWKGVLQLYPSYDNQMDTNITGSVGVTLDNSSIFNQFSQSAFGSVWGDWNVNGVVANNVTVSTDQNPVSGRIYTQPPIAPPQISTPVLYDNTIVAGIYVPASNTPSSVFTSMYNV